MNPYRCETCSYYLKYAVACDKIKERLIVGAEEWINKIGCASHSDFQSEREKVLDEILEFRKGISVGEYWSEVWRKERQFIESLRQEGKVEK